MKTKILQKTLLLALAIVAFAACKKEEVNPHEAIVGSWEIDKTYVNDNELSGPGTLVFEDCSSAPCPGVSTEHTDNTSGDIAWELSADGTELTITDTVSGGGAWNATYTIDKLTNEKLTMRTPSIFGELKLEMSKN